MKIKSTLTVVVFVLLLGLLSACSSLTPPQQAAIAATFEAVPAPQRTAIVATVRAMPTLSPEQVAAIKAKADAYIAAHPELAQPQAAPQAAAPTANPALPQILYWFASSPTSDQKAGGIAFVMNYYVQGADRVEIYGNQMANPQTGAWPVYQGPEVNPHWTITAFNSAGYVERYVYVEPDKDLGTALSPVTVNNRNVVISFRDPQYVDGDKITLILNGQIIWNQANTDGYPISLPVVLNSSNNTLQVRSDGEGDTPMSILEFTVSNVVSGQPIQTTRALRTGEMEVLNIAAP